MRASQAKQRRVAPRAAADVHDERLVVCGGADQGHEALGLIGVVVVVIDSPRVVASEVVVGPSVTGDPDLWVQRDRWRRAGVAGVGVERSVRRARTDRRNAAIGWRKVSMADRDNSGGRRPGPPRQKATGRERLAPEGEPAEASFEAKPSDAAAAELDAALRADVTGRDTAVTDTRQVTFQELLVEIRLRYARIRGSRTERVLAGLVLLALGALGWLVISLVVPWSGGIAGSIAGVLALNLPWTPLPGPDDQAVLGDTGLPTAAWVGAPLVIGAFWFVAAYHLDRASRRTYRVSEIPGVGHSTSYAAMAIVGGVSVDHCRPHQCGLGDIHARLMGRRRPGVGIGRGPAGAAAPVSRRWFE